MRQMTEEEIAEHRRDSERYHARLQALLDCETDRLASHAREAMATGTTTLTEPTGTFTVILRRPKWLRRGEVQTRGVRDRGGMGGHRFVARSDIGTFEDGIVLDLANGLEFLRQELRGSPPASG